MTASAEQRTVSCIGLYDRRESILLKNSSVPFLDFVQGVVEPLPDRRSSIVGDSERSISLQDGPRGTPTEFFNRIGRKPTPVCQTKSQPLLLTQLASRRPGPNRYRRCLGTAPQFPAPLV